MSDAASAVPAFRAERSVLHLQAVAAFFIGIKLVYIFSAGPIADEAYYWDWGLHPALSYYDHPPFHAWLLGLSHFLFGRSLLALRWMTLATMLGTFAIYRAWAQRWAGPDWREMFWRGVVVYLASTTFGFFTSLAMHDYMLAFLCLLSGHFFIGYFSDWRDSGRGRLLELYAGAFFLGLATLTKYNGVLFGLGLALYLLGDRRMRPLYRNVHLWLAAGLAVVMQAPVLVWNYGESFRPVLFHLWERHPAGWLDRIDPATFLAFFRDSLLLVSPFLAVGFARFMLGRPETPFARTAKGFAIGAFWASSAVFLFVALFDRVWWWWNLTAYVLLLPFAARYMGRMLFWGHVLVGTGLGLYLLVASAVVPVSLLWGAPDPTHQNLYGWDLIEAPVRRAQAAHETQFVATLGSETGGITAFALDDPGVTALTPLHNQFDYWFDPAAHRGEDAVVVMREWEDEGQMAGFFTRLTLLETIPIERFGYRIGSYAVYLGERFVPP